MINFKAVDYLLYLLIRDKMSACGNGFIQNIYTIQIIECVFPSTQCQPYATLMSLKIKRSHCKSVWKMFNLTLRPVRVTRI